VLRDDATRLAEAARAAGTSVSLDVVEDSVHSFILFDFLPEAGTSVAHARELLRTALTTTSSG
jgi:acetyl esterase/lipase